VECLTLLLDAGAALEVRDSKQWSALHWAASNGRPEATELLLRHGADRAAVNAEGNTPLQLAEAKRGGGYDRVVLLLGGKPRARRPAPHSASHNKTSPRQTCSLGCPARLSPAGAGGFSLTVPLPAGG